MKIGAEKINDFSYNVGRSYRRSYRGSVWNDNVVRSADRHRWNNDSGNSYLLNYPHYCKASQEEKGILWKEKICQEEKDTLKAEFIKRMTLS